MVRHFYLTQDQGNKDAVEARREERSKKDVVETRRLGNSALQLGVFRVILDLLSREPFAGTSVSWSWFVGVSVYKGWGLLCTKALVMEKQWTSFWHRLSACLFALFLFRIVCLSLSLRLCMSLTVVLRTVS